MTQPVLPITPERAERIFRVLVAYADADATQRTAFMYMMSDTGLGNIEFRIKAGWYGPTCFYIDNDESPNEWFVKTTNEDETPATRNQVDETNLQLALLRDSELP